VPAAYHEHPDIGALELAVLFVLATHANRQGACWPSQGTIATAAKLDRGTVNRLLAKLVDLKLVEKSRHPNPRIRSWMYRLVGHEALMEDFLSGLDETEHRVEKPSDAVSHTVAASVAETNTEHFEHSIEESLCATQGGANRPAADGVTIKAEWVPDAANMAFAQVRRPDLTPADVLLIGAKFALHYAGQELTNPTAIFHRWILTERATRHDNSSRSQSFSSRSQSFNSRPARTHQEPGLAQRNRAAADDCLRRILARRGEHLSA
jgi:DNA-binding MarR family transcriptional regulator